MTFTVGKPFENLPNPIRPGYTFAGWWTGETGDPEITSASIVPTSDATLYAHWTENKSQHDAVQLWEGGPYWATCNIDATNETDYGY